MKTMVRKTMCIVIAIIMSILTCACGASDVTDQVANVVQSEDEHVIGVKEATPYAYPGKTYGETFENFFGSPTWKYFVGTKEGPDEDGDGEPDYTEDNLDIVEFTGYCMYRDTEVKALIQFTLDMESGTFEATYLSFNDVPQTTFMLNALIDAAFTDGDLEETSNNEDTTDEKSENNISYGDYEETARTIIEDWFDRHPLMQNAMVQFEDTGYEDGGDIYLSYGLYTSNGEIGIFGVNVSQNDITMNSMVEDNGAWSDIQVPMEQWYLENYWGLTSNSGYYTEEISNGYYVIYSEPDCELLEYDAQYDSYAICNNDSYCSVVYADGTMTPDLEVGMQAFIGNFGYDASTSLEGQEVNFYYSLEIEDNGWGIGVTEEWRGNYIIQDAYATDDNLVGNTLVVSGFSDYSEIPESHTITFVPAVMSQLGTDTLYVDGDYDMPFTRE
jgi:hypothetical protein